MRLEFFFKLAERKSETRDLERGEKERERERENERECVCERERENVREGEEKRDKREEGDLTLRLWLDADVTGPTAQCSRGVHAYLKTNDGSGERETRIALISHDVFHVLDSRLRSTHGRKKRPAK